MPTIGRPTQQPGKITRSPPPVSTTTLTSKLLTSPRTTHRQRIRTAAIQSGRRANRELDQTRISTPNSLRRGCVRIIPPVALFTCPHTAGTISDSADYGSSGDVRAGDPLRARGSTSRCRATDRVWQTDVGTEVRPQVGRPRGARSNPSCRAAGSPRPPWRRPAKPWHKAADAVAPNIVINQS